MAGVLTVAAVILSIATSWTAAVQFSRIAQGGDNSTHQGHSAMLMVSLSTVSKIVLGAPLLLDVTVKKWRIPIPLRKWIRNTLTLFALWIVANYCFTRALRDLPASVVTSIFSIAPIIVVLVSFILLRSSISWMHGVVALAATAGVILVASPWQDKSLPHLASAALVLAAAITGALYKVLFKVFFGDTSFTTVCAVITTIAMLALVTVTPVSFLLMAFDLQTMPVSAIGPFLLSMLFSLLFDVAVNVGLAYTTPAVVAIATALGVPANLAADVIFHPSSVSTSPPQLAGYVVIFVSVVALVVVEHLRQQRVGGADSPHAGGRGRMFSTGSIAGVALSFTTQDAVAADVDAAVDRVPPGRGHGGRYLSLAEDGVGGDLEAAAARAPIAPADDGGLFATVKTGTA